MVKLWITVLEFVLVQSNIAIVIHVDNQYDVIYKLHGLISRQLLLPEEPAGAGDITVVWLNIRVILGVGDSLNIAIQCCVEISVCYLCNRVIMLYSV